MLTVLRFAVQTALSLGSDEDVWRGVMEDELQRVLGSLEASDGLAPIQEVREMAGSVRRVTQLAGRCIGVVLWRRACMTAFILPGID